MNHDKVLGPRVFGRNPGVSGEHRYRPDINGCPRYGSDRYLRKHGWTLIDDPDRWKRMKREHEAEKAAALLADDAHRVPR